MNYEAFETFSQNVNESPSRIVVPEGAYRPIKRCPNCQSVYLSDTKCEDCGRSLSYHPIGEPFGAKSLYGIKERYHESFNVLLKYYPIFENKKGEEARSYVRNLTKRFDALLVAFGENDSMVANNRRLFYVEFLELMDELLRYGIGAMVLQNKIEGSMDKIGNLLAQEFLMYLSSSQKENHLSSSWKEVFLNHRVLGGRVEYWIKVAIVTATVLIVAVNFYSMISLQVGK